MSVDPPLETRETLESTPLTVPEAMPKHTIRMEVKMKARCTGTCSTRLTAGTHLFQAGGERCDWRDRSSGLAISRTKLFGFHITL